VTTEYALEISGDLQRRLRRCRASIREAIHDRLQEIAVAAGQSRSRAKRLVRQEPPLRLYVLEGYRIFYQVDPETRRVVVLDLTSVPP
jgi:mRNA-degrading endonuclease RelE of RelBE toxin-antitoxin system